MDGSVAPVHMCVLVDQIGASAVVELAEAAGHAGVRWLTVRPRSTPVGAWPDDQVSEVGGCVVHVDGDADGRARLAACIERLAADQLDDAAVSASLNVPAPADPDLVVVAGTSDGLPRSVVWELAYAELVYTGRASVSPDDVTQALAEFARRHRRFGGVD